MRRCSFGILLDYQLNSLSFFAPLQPDGVTVAQQILVLFVRVQILVGLPFFFLFTLSQNLFGFLFRDAFVEILVDHHHRGGPATGETLHKLN